MQPKDIMANEKYIIEESLGYAMGRATRTMGALVNHNFAAAGFDVTCEQWSVIVNLGKKNVKQLNDGWTIVTADGLPSAHFEHDVAIVDGKADILSTYAFVEEALKLKL